MKRTVEGGIEDGEGIVFHIAVLRACTLRTWTLRACAPCQVSTQIPRERTSSIHSSGSLSLESSPGTGSRHNRPLAPRCFSAGTCTNLKSKRSIVVIQRFTAAFSWMSGLLSIHLYDKVSDANDMDTESTEGLKEPVELNLWLRVATLALIPGYRPEMQRPALAVFALLRKNPAYSAPRRVNC